ncbi:MAG: YciI family protein [Candidatus Promineifilaceae bacterium]
MRYILLINTDESIEAQRPKEENDAVYADYFAFSKEIRDSGAYITGEALQPTDTATTVRVRNGRILTTDGPYAETKEQLGGFYMIECADLDEAIAWAAKIPGAKEGAIEVRPIMEFE